MKFWVSIFFALWSVLASALPATYEKNASDHTATVRAASGMSVGTIAQEQRQLVESAKVFVDYTTDRRGIDGSAQTPRSKRFHRTSADKDLKTFSFTAEGPQAYAHVRAEHWIRPSGSRALCAQPAPNAKRFIAYRNLRI